LTITAKVIADSISLAGSRLTTLELRYPRFIHAEFMTHRVFSRNASSSRAIPVSRLIQDVLDDPAIPIHWGKNQPGMQAREEHDALVVFRNDAVSPERAWLRARDVTIGAAEQFTKAGYHKQIVNRLLEPFAHINVVVTATEWANFFELRDHEDAQPEIAVLARQMKASMDASTPQQLSPGQWHLPYVPDHERHELFDRYRSNQGGCQVSAARCARVSYRTHDGAEPNRVKDQELYAKLAAGVPKHLSPTEHQATPDTLKFHANFYGWRQFRKGIE
jgi:thymidylate synthase ThyX